jgi:hypothetical protein
VVLLMVLLAMMLVAVIRLPERHGSSEEAARPQPATAAPRMRGRCAAELSWGTGARAAQASSGPPGRCSLVVASGGETSHGPGGVLSRSE